MLGRKYLYRNIFRTTLVRSVLGPLCTRILGARTPIIEKSEALRNKDVMATAPFFFVLPVENPETKMERKETP